MAGYRNELYGILRDFMEVRHTLESLLRMLKVVECAYEQESKDIYMITAVRFYLEAVHRELDASIHRFDRYMVQTE